jgi:CYTH domain-containing protein
MARHLEIERKFLVKIRPGSWKSSASSQIVQGYLPTARKDTEIRLRRHGSKYFITVKRGHGHLRVEEEFKISQRRFAMLWPLTREARISKRRYRVPCDGHTIEVDVYRGPHRGLVTADIEFNSLRESRAFRPPEWLGREITGSHQYANKALARRQGLPTR